MVGPSNENEIQQPATLSNTLATDFTDTEVKASAAAKLKPSLGIPVQASNKVNPTLDWMQLPNHRTSTQYTPVKYQTPLGYDALDLELDCASVVDTPLFGMKKKRNCVQIPFLLWVKYHGFWYEKEKELCPNPLSS